MNQINNKNYSNKYHKYKAKYLALKKQLVGSGSCETNNTTNTTNIPNKLTFYLPCEITHYTKPIYYVKKIPNVGGGIDNMNETKIKHLHKPTYGTIGGYAQDPLIQLYCPINEPNFKYYDIIISSFTTTDTKLISDNNCRIQINANEYSKGGNFIAGPESSSSVSIPLHTIFTINGCNEKIITNLKEFGYSDDSSGFETQKKIIKLDCSFGASNRVNGNNFFRHIDEIMCFMPYGVGQYKVWFYDEFTCNDITHLIYVKEFAEKIKNNIKGFVDYYNNKSEDKIRLENKTNELSDITSKMDKIIKKYPENDDSYYADQEYIDLYLQQEYIQDTVIPKLKHNIDKNEITELIMNNILREFNLEQTTPDMPINFELEVNDFLSKLNAERMNNLNKISQALWGSNFNSNEDKFVFLKFYMNKRSLLNRSYIEANEISQTTEQNNFNPIILFPSDSSQNENNNIIQNQLPHLKSYITGKQVVIQKIQTAEPNAFRPEGGPHCLIKQQFKNPRTDPHTDPEITSQTSQQTGPQTTPLINLITNSSI
jgi:hypothetical protein